MNIIHSPYLAIIIAVAALSIILYGFYKAGGFTFLKRIIYDCLLDHNTGKITTNNLSRFSTLIVFLFVFLSVHYNIQLKPFHITTVPFTEWELGIILAFIVGAEWVRKAKPDTNNINVKSENTIIENNGNKESI